MNQLQENFEMTQTEIAQAIGVSRSMVNYIERQALEKLKKALEERGIKLEDVL
jgi:DNA-directed RNA polymerase specialized sigma subunit